MPAKGQIIIQPRFCIICGKELWKYSKITNKFNKNLCQKCFWSKKKKQWMCIICGKPVNRRVKRCSNCNKEFRKTSGKYIRTPEIKRKMSISHRISPKCLIYHKSRIGYKHKPETIAKMRKTWSCQIRRQNAKIRGDKMAQDIKWLQKLSIALSGKNNPNWKGGISKKSYACGFTKNFKQMIRERDNFECQLCKYREQDLSYNLTIHHIDYNKSNHNPENLVSLCKRCNSFVNFDRKYWTYFFQYEVS